MYAGQWSFEDSDSKEVGAIKEEAMRDPGSFVLKVSSGTKEEAMRDPGSFVVSFYSPLP